MISVVRVINFIKMFFETPFHDKSPGGCRNTGGMSQLIKQYAASPQSTLCKVEKKQSIFTKNQEQDKDVSGPAQYKS